MSKKSLPIIIALAALAGILIYLKTRPAQDITIAPDSQSTQQVITEAQKFAAAIASGEPYTCQITSADTTLSSQFMGGKMYMTNTTEGITTHILNDTSYFYSWQEGAATGTKIAVSTDLPTETSTEAPTETPSFTSANDYQAYEDAGYTITCQKDNFDDTLFTPPTEVEFTDPSAMLKEAMPDGQTLDMDKLQEMAKQYEGMMTEDN